MQGRRRQWREGGLGRQPARGGTRERVYAGQDHQQAGMAFAGQSCWMAERRIRRSVGQTDHQRSMREPSLD